MVCEGWYGEVVGIVIGWGGMSLQAALNHGYGGKGVRVICWSIGYGRESG